MSLIRYTATLLALSSPLVFASIEDLEQRFYSEESFTRISEYFDGVEDAGGRTIIRSDANARTGHYVTFKLSARYDIDHFKLEVYEPGSAIPVDYVFKPESSVDPTRPIFLGLTGDKWTEKTSPPVAYKVSVIGTNGDVLDSSSSFLWGDD